MNVEVVINSRPDREIKKLIISKGDYSIVPYEDSRCKIILSDVTCINDAGPCEIEKESVIFSSSFDGNVLIGDLDCFIDKDFELILQQMCCGEECSATITYNDFNGKLAKQISFKIKLVEVTEEQLISDWGWERLLESSLHHKECGVRLIKESRILDAFRRFTKSLKLLIAIEPIDPEVIDNEKLKEMMDLKVKLFNNLAHCQLQYNQYEATLELCNRALSFDTENIKAVYRRSIAYFGMKMYEEAWNDIQQALRLDPNDKAIQHMKLALKPEIDKINEKYSQVVKKMFK